MNDLLQKSAEFLRDSNVKASITENWAFPDDKVIHNLAYITDSSPPNQKVIRHRLGWRTLCIPNLPLIRKASNKFYNFAESKVIRTLRDHAPNLPNCY